MNLSTLPHKNIYISGGIALLIIGVGAFLKYQPSLFQNTEGNVLTMGTETASSTITSRDTDGDGLYDWEEQLYNTDSKKQDTDGDKTSDKEEVNLGRDPLKANTAKEGEDPSDLTENSVLLLNASTELSEQKKAFLTQYLAQAGKDVRETTYRDLLSKFDAKKYTPTRQELTGLNVVSDNTDEGFRTFINEFGKVVLRHKTKYAPRNEMDLLNEYTQTQNPKLLKDLELCVIEYQNLIKDLRALPIPSGMTKVMLGIIDGYEGMSLGVQGLSLLKENPIEAAGGYESYTIYRVQVINGYAVIVNELAKRGMVFAETEPAYMFYTNVFKKTEPAK